MFKKLTITLLALSISITGYAETTTLDYPCSSKDFIQYEIEMLFENFYDPQFDLETKEQIIEEYQYYVSQSDMLEEACH